jgi:hypothetical protein
VPDADVPIRIVSSRSLATSTRCERRQRMRLGQRQQQLLAHHQFDLDVGFFRQQPLEHQLHALLPQRGDLHRRLRVVQHHLDVGVRGAEARQQLGHDAEHRRAVDADVEPPGVATAGAPHAFAGQRDERADVARVLQQFLARPR